MSNFCPEGTPTPMRSWTVIRAEIAGRSRNPEADTTQLRRELALARVEQKIADAVEAAPPLPADLVDHLVSLIRAAPSTQDGQ